MKYSQAWANDTQVWLYIKVFRHIFRTFGGTYPSTILVGIKHSFATKLAIDYILKYLVLSNYRWSWILFVVF